MVASRHFVLYAALVVVGVTAKLRRGGVSPLQPAQKPSAEGYSFVQFARDFDRNYVSGSAEYKSRASVFEASLNNIHAVNQKNQRDGSQWRAGIHQFMDWTKAERNSLKGYKPNRGPHSRVAKSLMQMSESSKVQLNMSRSASAVRSFSDSTFGGESVSVRNQGTCGSCWAISAVEAIEARLPDSMQVSAQALVDCVPNPRHCGGSGGCDGATGELAYEYARDHGLPVESSYAYTGKGDSCHAETAYPTTQRVKISGWTNTASNQAQPLMEALYNSGPVVVAVDADEWFDYDQGIFDGCKKDAVLDHAVLAKGYGGEGDAMWWRIQNSWGGNWGEQGHIRLKRRETAAESAYCGQDKKPSEGLGCDGGPAEVTVCGTCGLLYDPIYPEGVTLEGGSADSGPSASFSSVTPAPKAVLDAERDFLKDDKEAIAPAPTAVQDYQKYLMDDKAEVVIAPKVEAAVSQPTASMPDLFAPPVSSVSADSTMQGMFQPEASPEASPAAIKTDSANSDIDRMKNLFHQNFLQAQN